MKNILLIVGSSLLSAILAVVIYSKFVSPTVVIQENGQNAQLTNFAESTKAKDYILATPTDFTAAAEKVTNSVVYIKSLSKSYDWWGSANYGTSSGSGVIISNDGYIVTNNHVIEDASEIEVSMNDKRTFTAKLIGTDPTTDLALLKVEGKGLPYVQFANSDKSKIGEWVLAVGNPFSLTSTVTAGIISAKGRNIEILEDRYAIESFIQTDAAVNPGNSGGALVNTNGDLVGINTAIITKSGRYEGYSFAVPANLVKKVVADLKDFGKVQRGLLNVTIDAVTPIMAKELGLATAEGVYIRMVNPGGAAAEGGIKMGDVITGINNKSITSIPELQEAVGTFRPGDKITVEYFRKGKKNTSTVTLKDRFNNTKLAAKNKTMDMRKYGFELRNLTSDEAARYKSNGVKVVSIYRNSKIDGTNMEPGYIITKINDKDVANVEGMNEILESVSKGKKVMLEGFYEDYPDEYFYTFRK